MKLLFTLALIFLLSLFSETTNVQQVGSKVSFIASDGKNYSGTITEMQGDKFKIKYDGFDFSTWLMANQFTVIEDTQPANNLPPTPDQAQQNSAQTENKTSTHLKENGKSGKKILPNTDSLQSSISKIKNAFGTLNKLLGKKEKPTDTIK